MLETSYTPIQTQILKRLRQGPATVGQLALEVYGHSDTAEARCIYTHICLLRRRGPRIKNIGREYHLIFHRNA